MLHGARPESNAGKLTGALLAGEVARAHAAACRRAAGCHDGAGDAPRRRRAPGASAGAVGTRSSPCGKAKSPGPVPRFSSKVAGRACSLAGPPAAALAPDWQAAAISTVSPQVEIVLSGDDRAFAEGGRDRGLPSAAGNLIAANDGLSSCLSGSATAPTGARLTDRVAVGGGRCGSRRGLASFPLARFPSNRRADIDGETARWRSVRRDDPFPQSR